MFFISFKFVKILFFSMIFLNFQMLVRCLELLRSGGETSALHTILILSSLLERSLGDVSRCLMVEVRINPPYGHSLIGCGGYGGRIQFPLKRLPDSNFCNPSWLRPERTSRHQKLVPGLVV